MIIFFTIFNVFICVAGIELFILMGKAPAAGVFLVGLPILFVVFIGVALLNNDLILSHLKIVNIIPWVLLFIVIMLAEYRLI